MTDIENNDDLALIDQIRGGDFGAFRALVLRHQRRVCAIAYRVTGNDEDARDVAQEVFVKVYTSLSVFDRTKRFTTWLYRITVNAAIDIRRRQSRTEVSLESMENEPHDNKKESQPDRAVETRELKNVVEQVAGKLTKRQRVVFVLRDLEDFTTDEIADMLECSVATVRVHLATARERIREALMKRYPEFNTTYGKRENQS